MGSHYFTALTAEIPFDTAPGDVNLIEAANEIQDAIMAERAARGIVSQGPDYDVDSALHAGYLLGVQIGLRMRTGGAR